MRPADGYKGAFDRNPAPHHHESLTMRKPILLAAVAAVVLLGASQTAIGGC